MIMLIDLSDTIKDIKKNIKLPKRKKSKYGLNLFLKVEIKDLLI